VGSGCSESDVTRRVRGGVIRPKSRRFAVSLIDIPAAADKFATTERHIRELIYRREIPYLKVGHLVRFDPDELAEWIDAQRVPEAGRAAQVS